MYSTKQSSKSSGFRCLEHMSKMSGADSSCYQMSSRWLLQKHTNRHQKHRTRGALKNMCSVNPLKLFKNVSVIKFLCVQSCRFVPAILQKLYCPCFPRNLLYFTVHIYFRTDLIDSLVTCSKGCVICSYSKTSKTKKSNLIGVYFYKVVSQTCNFVNNEP